MSVSKAILIGRIGSDLVVKVTASGISVCNFKLACDTGFGDKKQTSWHTVIAWRNNAENLAKYCKKGSQIYVEGELIQRSYVDKTAGATKYVTEIIAEFINFLDPKSTTNDDPKPMDTAPDDIPW